MAVLEETITDELHTGGDMYFRELIKENPGLDIFWLEYKKAFAPEFIVYVDNIIKKVRQIEQGEHVQLLKQREKNFITH